MYDAIEIIDGMAVINESCVYCGACIDVCKFISIEIVGMEELEERDFSDYSGVCVYLETNNRKIIDVGYELISAGRILADKLNVSLSAIAIGNEFENNVG